MQPNIIYIVNNKLHNFKYWNYTIVFYAIIFYTFYRLFSYLLNKNYTMLLLYIIFFTLFYSHYKNFTYFLGFIMLIIFRIFNIDTIINNNVIIEGNDFSSLMSTVEDKADKKGDKLKKDFKSNKPPPNPCKSYIINKLQEAGINISGAGAAFNSNDKKSSTQSKIDDILRGHKDLVPPKFYRL